jgi:hypothetical protein
MIVAQVDPDNDGSLSVARKIAGDSRCRFEEIDDYVSSAQKA